MNYLAEPWPLKVIDKSTTLRRLSTVPGICRRSLSSSWQRNRYPPDNVIRVLEFVIRDLKWDVSTHFPEHAIPTR